LHSQSFENLDLTEAVKFCTSANQFLGWF